MGVCFAEPNSFQKNFSRGMRVEEGAKRGQGSQAFYPRAFRAACGAQATAR